MSGFETAHDVTDKAADTTKALSGLREELDQNSQIPGEFIPDEAIPSELQDLLTARMDELVNFLFEMGIIYDISAKVNEELPNGEYHIALETEENDSEKGWEVKNFSPNDSKPTYKHDPEGKKAYKGELATAYGWVPQAERDIVNVMARKMGGIRLPKERYEEFFIALKIKINGKLEELGYTEALLDTTNAGMRGVRRALKLISLGVNSEQVMAERAPIIKERVEKYEMARAEGEKAEKKALEEELNDKEFERMGITETKAITGTSLRAAKRQKEKEENEVRKMIGRNWGTPAERKAILDTAMEAGLGVNSRENREQNYVSKAKIDADIAAKKKIADRLAKKKARAEKRGPAKRAE